VCVDLVEIGYISELYGKIFGDMYFIEAIDVENNIFLLPKSMNSAANLDKNAHFSLHRYTERVALKEPLDRLFL
jgi:hypothetical protein